MPSNHIQYFSRKPGVAATGGRGVTTTAGAGSCGADTAAGASCFTTGAGAGAGSTGAALGGAALTAFFFAFFTTGLGAGCSATAARAGAGCSATATGAGAGAASGAGATTGAGAGVGSAIGASCLVAQAETASAEQNRATGSEILCILDMVFSSATVEKTRFRGNPPIVSHAKQTSGVVCTRRTLPNYISFQAYLQHRPYLINPLCNLQ